MILDRGYGGLMGEEDDFFQPKDLSFIDPQAQQPVERQPPAPVGMAVPGNVAPQQTAAPTKSRVVDPLSYGFRDIGEGEHYQTGLGNVQDYFNLAPLGDLSKFAQSTYQGEGEYTTKYDLPGLSNYLSQQGMELREMDLPGNKVARWVQGPQGVIKDTYQEINLTDKDFGLASALATAAAGSVVGAPMQLLNAARAAESGDALSTIANLAGGVSGLTGVPKDIADVAGKVKQGAQLAQAIKKEDPFGALAAATSLAGVKDIGGYAVKDILNYGKAAQALAQGDAGTALLSLQNVLPKTDSETKKWLDIAGNVASAARGNPLGGIKALIGLGTELDLLKSEAEAEEKVPKFAGYTPTANTASTGEDAETLPGEDFAAERPLTESEIEDMLYALEPGGGQAPMTQEELEQYLGIGPERVEVTGQRLQDLSFLPEDFGGFDTRLPDTVRDLILNAPAAETPTDKPADQQVEVVGKRLQDLEFVPSDLPALDTKLPENIKDLILNPPSAQPPSQQIEVTGQRLQDIAPLDIDLEAAKKAEDAIFNIPSAQAPAERIEVTGKREPVYDVPSLDVLEELLGGPQRIEITGKREPSDALYDVPDPGFLPELFGGPSELQRIPVTAPRKLEPIDLGLTFEEPGPLITPPDKLPEDLEKLITTPPAVTPAPAPSPRAPAPSPRPSPTPPPPRAGRPDLSGLFALLGMLSGKGGGGPEALQLANVAPGVEAGLRAIEEMYGSRRG